ncbi:SsgA family sporulation/cell division regulator [Streptomyces sp. NPDC004393]|uniref:SsgA family sporulation/cell division regulator n=2 Tax=unclassified Streptomyces TaxID=2593676 RepID=UPI00339DD9BA
MICCVDHMLDMELETPQGLRVTVPTQLLYRAQDPLSVEFLFHDIRLGPVPWTFARELLTTGLLTPSGDGDVRVWPTGTGAEALLHLTLSSPHGSAHLTTALKAVERWLCRTYQLVPSDREVEALDLETRLTRFLEEGA